MKILTIPFLLFSIFLNAQDYINPVDKMSFGLNNHTNRDISYFSVVDSNNNVVSIGTTEKDSTFTDIITTKLDSNLNQVWQRQFSFETNLSYDIPVSVNTDNSDNIYVSLRSSTSQSYSNGYPILLKYDLSGNEQWSLNLTEFLGIEAYDYRIFKTYLDNSGFLKVIYAPVNTNTYYFLTIDPHGNIISNSEIFLEAQLLLENYVNGKHVLFYNETNSGTGNDSDLFIRFINSSIDETYQLNNQSNFQNDFDSNNLQEVKFLTDINHNSYLVWQQNSSSNEGQYLIIRIDDDGSINYSTSSDPNTPTTLLDAFVNSDNHLSILSNEYSSSDPNNTLLTLVEYEEVNPNIIHTQTANTYGGSVKINKDNSLLIFTDTNEITLFTENLSVLNEFTISTNNIIDDLTKVSNNEIITAETSLGKMYPESDYFTQLDLIINKYSPTQLLSNYSFNGIGTSKAFNQAVMVDNDNNYVLFSQEKLGPDNFSIGGSRAPLHKSVSKYSSDLELLWTLEVPNLIFILGDNFLIDSSNNIFINSLSEATGNYELLKISEDGNLVYSSPSFQSLNMYFDSNGNINLSSGFITNPNTYDEDIEIYVLDKNDGSTISMDVFESQAFLQSYLSDENDSYTFIYHPNNQGTISAQKISVYKNMTLDFEVELALPSNYSKINYASVNVDESGTLYFTTSWGSNDNQLHKISLSNTYSSINLNNNVIHLKILNNGKIFTIASLISNSEGFIEIYNNDLSLFTSNSDIVFDDSLIFTIGDYVFLNSHFDNLVKVYNENALLIDQFKISSTLAYANLISDDSFVLTGKFGKQISTFQDYSWARGLLHKYIYDGPQDDDNDGIGNSIDLCADTPQGEEVNISGCSSSQLDDDFDGVTNNIDLCPETEPNLEVNENGCAEQQLDDDADGITNDMDFCPQTVLIDYVNSQGCFYLPNNNFNVLVTDETCLNENNGKISVSTIASLNYRLILDGSEYNFTDSLLIENLSPGIYQMCIFVDEENYEQCYNIEINPGIDLNGRTVLNGNSLDIEIDNGTPPYNVYINQELTLVTSEPLFSIPVKQNDILQIFSSRSCEGIIESTIDYTNRAFLKPNPTSGIFQIVFESEIQNIPVIIYNSKFQLIYGDKLSSQDNKVEVNISNYSEGVYFVKLGELNPKYFKLIKN